MQIEFLGATREVTGSKFLITTKGGKRILLDCGMYQGKGLETDELNRNLGFDPKEIDFLILSHAFVTASILTRPMNLCVKISTSILQSVPSRLPLTR